MLSESNSQDSALNDVAFLALSENRIGLLGVLSDTQTHTRGELMDTTDVSRPALGRTLDAHWEAITTGTHQFEAVVIPYVVETMTEPADVSQFTDILTADQATVFVCDETRPDVIGINDDVVYFGVDDDERAPLALIETDDEVIRKWAEETFESYQKRAPA